MVLKTQSAQILNAIISILFLVLLQFRFQIQCFNLRTSLSATRNSQYEGSQSLEVLGVLSERLLGPLWNQVHGLSVPLDLLVKRGILVTRRHLCLLGQHKLQVVNLLVSGGHSVHRLQRLVEHLDVAVHELHSVSQSLLLWRRQSRGLLPEIASVTCKRSSECTEHG